MTDEIKERLQNSAAECLKCYEGWRGNKKDSGASQALQDAVHELRKVASRLEIELAVSERDEFSQKKIPIPSHRDARGRHQSNDDFDDEDDNHGNGEGGGKSGGQGQNMRRHRRPMQHQGQNHNHNKKPASSGGAPSGGSSGGGEGGGEG